VVAVVVVVAALLEAALITVAPSAPPAIDPATIAAATPLRVMLIGSGSFGCVPGPMRIDRRGEMGV
jgi:hypothetical protein